MPVVDKDFGWKQIEKNLKALKYVKITAGVHSNAGYTDGVSVADYATSNEFGADKIPPRPFMRTSFDENVDKWQREIDKTIKAVQEDTIGLRQGVGRIAYMVVNDIVAKIDSIYEPPNADSTKKRKGSDKPLIDTGKLRNSILSEITGV